MEPAVPRKTRKSYNEVGHCHALTFSAYRRQQLLADPTRAEGFLSHLFEASTNLEFDVLAFVVMPEHCHLLIYPQREDYVMAAILRAIKSPFAKEAFQLDPSLKRLCQVPRKGRADEFRFWQTGGGYDRNLWTPSKVRGFIEYIHLNPVRRSLCESPGDWPWSSFRNYGELDTPWPVCLYS